MSETNQVTGGATRALWRRRWLWTGGGVLAALALLLVFAAPRARAFQAFGGGFRGGHGHGFGARLLSDPAAVKQHAGLAVEFVLRGVNGTDEQRQRARQITDRLIDQLGPLAQQHRQIHDAAMAELAKPQIDRQALEKLRREMIGLADQASKAVVSAVADLGDVLTPEQRSQLLEFARRFHDEATPPIG